MGSCSILAEFGTLSLEFQYLSDLTGNPIYSQKVKLISCHHKSIKIHQLYNDQDFWSFTVRLFRRFHWIRLLPWTIHKIFILMQILLHLSSSW